MTNWVEWNGGECPIKSEDTRGQVKFRDGEVSSWFSEMTDWCWGDDGEGTIIAYRIIEDHEPMAYPRDPKTREQITAQIATLQKQLDAMPVHKLRRYWDGRALTRGQHPSDTHYFDIETINGVPHIHGVAMKEVGE
jgi:hypothetical protein